MRKATVFTLTFVFFMLTVAHKANAAKCTVINNSLFRLAVAHASWMEADGKYPEGFRVQGWFYVEPGKQQTFFARNDIYVRVEPLAQNSTPFKPANSPHGAEYSFRVAPYQLHLTRNSFTTVETNEGKIIYNSTERALLVGKNGFYEFTQNGTFEVSGDGRDAGIRKWRREELADASTYSCTAQATFSATPVPNSQTYAEKQYSNDGKGQAVTDKRVVDVEKYAVTRKKAGLWTRPLTVSPLDELVESPVILTVKFLNRRSEFFSEKKAKKIEEIASTWSLYGNIEFKFVKSGPADFSIRLEPPIATDEDGHPLTDENNEPVRIAKYSSYIGTDAKGEVMNLCFTDWENTSAVSRLC